MSNLPRALFYVSVLGITMSLWFGVHHPGVWYPIIVAGFGLVTIVSAHKWLAVAGEMDEDGH